MGNGMNKVLHGLYVGNFSDSRDKAQLSENGITHIVSIHDNARPALADKTYLCIEAEDRPDEQLVGHFGATSEFIHKARLSGGVVLVHCLAGVSRSVTIATAYIMVATDLSWKEALNAVRGARRCANPNMGFQKQLQDWEHGYLRAFKNVLYSKHPRMSVDDRAECKRLVEIHRLWVLNGDIDKDLHPTYPLRQGAYASSAAAPRPESSASRKRSPLPAAPVNSPSEESPASASAAAVAQAAAAAAHGPVQAHPDSAHGFSADAATVDGGEAAPRPAAESGQAAEPSDADRLAVESPSAVTVRIGDLEEWDK